MATVTTKSLGKTYPNGFEAVKDLDLDLHDGEFLVLVGPSGCGKSTALRMIAGLEEISSGELYIGDRLANDVAPKDRDIAMVFQNYALYPHMTVRDNIAFALKLAKVPKDEIDRRVTEAARVLELEANLERKPSQLSGGQRQRVAMGRAIVRQPAAFLMDEPLSNLDAKLRVQMRAEIARIQKNLGVTTLYVTHDQVEAMTMADRVAVLSAGILQQVDEPSTLYDNPANRFVASFIGSPPMNMFTAQLSEANGGLSVQLGSQTVDIPAEVVAGKPRVKAYAGREVIFGIRPEDLEDASEADPGLPTITANVALIEALGAEKVVHLGLDAQAAESLDPDHLQGIGLKESEEAQSLPVGRFSPRSTAREDERIQVAVDAARVHFFDPESGLAITS